jgi:hypothetical protein
MTKKSDAVSKKSTSYAHIAMGMLATGLNAIREIQPDPSKHSLLRAVIHLKSLGHVEKADELAKYIKRNWPPKKSKTRPKTGDVRMYSVLQQDSINYARIPMESLGAAKGDTVQAVFEEDKITLRHVKFEPMKYADARKAKQKKPSGAT